MYPKPEIVQFHDILNKRQIQYLRNDSNKERDFLLSMTKDELNPVERLGATLWHFTNSSQESLKIMKTVEKATGLIATEKQRDTAIQIATYAPGSHFSVHPDTVSQVEEPKLTLCLLKVANRVLICLPFSGPIRHTEKRPKDSNIHVLRKLISSRCWFN